MVNVDKTPFLNESNVSGAKVVDVVGGFALRIQFDHAGTAMLEQYTVANRGRKIAVLSQFGEELKNLRWLAAPFISRRITDGVLLFTPDATREEAEEIALGLNNVVKKTQTWIDK
jgi:preprotein translocase subunit SecD